MDIVIGSQNKTKVQAVQAVFPNKFVKGTNVSSGVSSQPIGDEETLEGAINRAYAVQQLKPGNIGIGLEGGIMRVSGKLFLCNWGALLTTNGTVYTAAGARIELPETFSEKLDEGIELSDIMDAYTAQEDIRNHEGAIGIFTNNLIDRSEMFVHVVTLLKGQYLYWNKSDKKAQR